MYRQTLGTVTDVKYVTLTPVGPVGAKVAEIDVSFIRLPFVTDSTIKSGVISICNMAFAALAPNLTAQNARIETYQTVGKCTVDVYDGGAPYLGVGPVGLFPWGAIIALILGAVIAGIIIYWVVVRPKDEALQEIKRILDEVVDDKHAALARGEISQEYSDELDGKLDEAAKEAEEAGDDPLTDWAEYFEKMFGWMKWLPYIVLGGGALWVISMLPKGKD